MKITFKKNSQTFSISYLNDFEHFLILLIYLISRQRGTTPECDVFFIKINNNIKCNFINIYFPKQLRNSAVQWFYRGITTNLSIIILNLSGDFKMCIFQTILKTYISLGEMLVLSTNRQKKCKFAFIFRLGFPPSLFTISM